MAFQEVKSQIAGKVHFIGIGGIGMSALALLLNKIGVRVQGSDLGENCITKNLAQNQIEIFKGHDAKNIDEKVGLVVKTSIIKDENPEIIAAKKLGLKIITRAELLAQIMSHKKGVTVAGTHGKTSTTAIISLIFEFAKLDPTVINGGIIHYFKSNCKIGNGDYLVAESDESDASFVNLPTFIGAITNIEPEHLDFYGGDFEKVKKHYEKYVAKIPQDGLCVICIDDEESQKIYEKFKHQKNIVSYSVKKDADIMARNIVQKSCGSTFDVELRSGATLKNLHLPACGIHNVSNSLVAIAVANFLAIEESVIKEALKNCTGVKRRFSKTGEVKGVTIIDDYAHHPTEITAALESARQCAVDKKVILVLQPHKFSRVKDLFEDFCICVKNSDIMILADIYGANQEPIAGISQDSLLLGIKKAGHKNAIKLQDESELAGLVKAHANSGDIVIFAGAGTITNWANDLPEKLQKIS